MTPDDWIKLAPDAVTAAGTLLVAWVASRGLGAWKQQLTGQSAYEVSRRTLRGVLRVRDAIRDFRAVALSHGEREAAIEEEKVQLDEGEGPDSPKAVFAAFRIRWKPLTAALTELEAEVVEAEVLFGGSIEWQYASLCQHAEKLWWAMKEHVNWLELAEYERDDAARKTYLEQYAILHDPSDKDGTYMAQLGTILQGFEGLLRPHLVPPQSLASRAWKLTYSKLPKRKPKPMPWETGEPLVRRR